MVSWIIYSILASGKDDSVDVFTVFCSPQVPD